jgi:hypothetical protein
MLLPLHYTLRVHIFPFNGVLRYDTLHTQAFWDGYFADTFVHETIRVDHSIEKNKTVSYTEHML